MLKVVRPDDLASRPSLGRWPAAAPRRRRVSSRRPIALEPRLLFDGAAFATVDATVGATHDAAVDAVVDATATAHEGPAPDPQAASIAVAMASRLETQRPAAGPAPVAGGDGRGAVPWTASTDPGCDGAAVQTSVIATSAAHTEGGDVAVGEVVTFRTVITPAQGRSVDATLVQHLDDGLLLLGVDRIDVGDCVATDRVPDAASIGSRPSSTGVGTDIEIGFGAITATGDAASIVVEFRVRVENVASNQQGRALTSAATFVTGAAADGAGHDGHRSHDRDPGREPHGDGRGRADPHRDGRHGGHAARDGGHDADRGPGRSGHDRDGRDRDGRDRAGHDRRGHDSGGHDGGGHDRDGHDRDGGVRLVSDTSEALAVVEPQLTIEVVPDGGPVAAGGVARFTVTVRNDGAVDAFDVGLDDVRLPPGLAWREGSFVQLSGPRFDVSTAWNGDGERGDGPAIGPFEAGAVAVFRFEATVGDGAAAGEALPVTVTVRYTSLPGDVAPAAGTGVADCPPPGAGAQGEGAPSSPQAVGERTGFGGPGTLDDYVASDQGSVVPVRADAPVTPANPGDGGGSGGGGPGVSPAPPPAPPPSLPPVAVAPPPPARPVDDAPFEDPRAPLLDVLPTWPGPAEIALAPIRYAPVMPDGIRIGDDLPAVPKGAFGGTEPSAKDDDCVPAKPVPAATAVVKRAVPLERGALAAAARKPPSRPASFSEQIGAEQRKFRPPAIVRPPRPPDC
ncbi:MAG: hypothetical protein AB7P21_13735 [Lautropia sp.]